MEFTIEFFLFLVVGFVAIIAAVGMLLSNNAVHSALFLVLNFACVAFLYLVLQAAFLAMVQVAVYAGAIMVLFMFVIMLLGAEKMSPTEQPYPWLAPAGIGLSVVLLLTAGLGILNSDISAQDPEPLPPLARVINVIPQYEAIEVHLNGQVLASDVGFRNESDLTELAPGEYSIEVLAYDEAGNEVVLPLSLLRYSPPVEVEAVDPDLEAQAEVIEEAAESAEEAAPPDVVGEEIVATLLGPTLERLPATLTLEANSYVTLVITRLEDDTYGIIPVAEDLNTVEVSKSANVQLVHADVNTDALDLAEVTQADREPHVVIDGLGFGGYSEIHSKHNGDFQYGLYAAGLIAQFAEANEDFSVSDVPQLAEYDEKEFLANHSTLYVVAPPLNPGLVSNQQPELLFYITENRPAFGGPVSVGRLLFTTYMLPFQVIALLLLVAMIGAIVLTRDQVAPPRKRFPRRLASTGAPVVGGQEE
jgi:NADH:ubiquinone oxidoreductase subunit 6 (subunit J)